MTSRPASETTAYTAVQLWARRFLISDRELRAAVIRTEEIPLHLVRSRWMIRRRHIEPRWRTTESRARKLAEPLDPVEIDPWGESSEELRARTHQIVACPTCRGAKKAICTLCQGSARVSCSVCGGSGWAWSPRSRRSIGCRSCRKTGMRVCACFDGSVACETCAGRGKVERWLEIIEETFSRVRAEGDEQLARLFPKEGDEAGILEINLAPTLSWSGAFLHEAPEEVREILLRPQIVGLLDARSERLQSVSLRVFDASLMRVQYQLCGRNGSVDVQSWDGRVHENLGSTEPLRQRLRWMKASASGAVLMGLALTVWFGMRHPFYLASSHLPWLGGLGLLLALVVLPLVAVFALPRSTISPGPLTAAALPSALVLSAQIALAATGRPSLEHAQALAQAGNAREARLEAAACADLGIDGQNAKVFHDQLQMEELRTIRDPEQAWKAAELPLYTPDGRHQAKEHALSASLREVAARQAEGDFDTGKALLSQIPPPYMEDLRVRNLLLRDDLYRAQSLWTAIRSSEPLESRLQACEEIQSFLPALESADEPVPLSKTRVESQCASLDRERLREIARREREIERQREAEERERRRAQRAAEAAARAWANAPLLCRDGSASPSCVCGQSSRRGCCSHHGGVAGCTKDWPGTP